MVWVIGHMILSFDSFYERHPTYLSKSRPGSFSSASTVSHNRSSSSYGVTVCWWRPIGTGSNNRTLELWELQQPKWERTKSDHLSEKWEADFSSLLYRKWSPSWRKNINIEPYLKCRISLWVTPTSNWSSHEGNQLQRWCISHRKMAPAC